ncbi:caspase [Verrucomicrobia bacterium LW23]|nr:caspase [Verrucomicrobia bacterium LW23]
MARTVYALLVGIDTYLKPVQPLSGCVGDIVAISALLESQVRAAGDTWMPLQLMNEAATRPAIIEGFRRHLGQAKAGDVALFYFSGHGSNEKCPPEFWKTEPDRLNETLVCYDSRSPGGRDLADKETAELITQMCKGVHVTIIFDCCHSGSGTRNLLDIGVRQVPTDMRERPFSEYIGTGTRSAAGTDWTPPPQGPHILISACRSDELAKEITLGGKRRGVFSYFLGETLAQSPGALSYRQVFKRVNAMVRNNAAQQSPQIEPTDLSMLDLPFLGGLAKSTEEYYTLSHSSTAGWVIDAGAIHGIPEPTFEETTVFSLFPHNTPLDQCRRKIGLLGTAKVTQVEAGRSLVSCSVDLSPDTVYIALLSGLPLAPLKVHFAGDAAGLTLLRGALATATGTAPSLFVREVPTADNADIQVHAVNTASGAYFSFFRTAESVELIARVADHTAGSAVKAVKNLEHIARWTRITDLTNPAEDADDLKVRLEVYNVVGAAGKEELVNSTNLRQEYGKDAFGKWTERPRIKVKVANDSDVPLYCTLVGLTAAFEVETGFFTGGTMLLQPGQAAWAWQGKSFRMSVPAVLTEAGILETKDVLKLIASTEDFDGSLLSQDALELPYAAKKTTSTRGIGSSTLFRMVQRVQTRSFDLEPEEGEMISRWCTREFHITTMRPLDSAAVPSSPEAVASVHSAIQVLGHPSLKAQVRVSTASVASRDVLDDGGLIAPPLLRDNAGTWEPLFLSEGTRGEPGLSVLELHNVAEGASVTRKDPLRIRLTPTEPLKDDEHLVPITHDGKYYLPIGHAAMKDGALEVTVTALPAPQNTRSLTSAVKILFQKLKSKYLKTVYEYPLLAIHEVDGSSTTTPQQVATRVATAQRIMLYIHGIIGETRDMAASSAGLPGDEEVEALRQKYDLVLTFDYENLHTPIEENARLLKARLAAAGLAEGHGKTLHIVAHSMGGLVSRWFIEQEGGNKVAQHLVMLGTPNGGSPWSSIEDWAISTLTLGLNGLSTVFWPAPALGALVSLVEKADVALDQMNPRSDFLQKLNTGGDPGIPYTIIAGNTTLLSPFASENAAQRRSLIDRLKNLNLIHATTSALVFGTDNDIAVTVEDILKVPAGRTPAVVSYEVPCDHITYFGTRAGLQALSKALENA